MRSEGIGNAIGGAFGNAVGGALETRSEIAIVRGACSPFAKIGSEQISHNSSLKVVAYSSELRFTFKSHVKGSETESPSR